MPARRYEDRVAYGGRMMAMRLLPDGRWAPMPSETRAPVLPPVHGTRASSPHLPVTTEQHVHEHSAHGHPGGEAVYGMRPGSHMHAHSHRGDNNHDHHAAPAPGHPGHGLPDAFNSADPGGETRDGGLEDIDLGAAIGAYLEQQGVDVGRAIAEAGYERDRQAQAARETADRAVHIARSLRAAKRALAFEQSGFLRRCSGFGIGKIGEAQQRVDQLNAALADCCRDNPEVMSEARQRAAR